MLNRFTNWLRRLWPVVGEEERAIRRELTFHIERLAEEFRAKGMFRRAARREALKRFGQVGYVEQAVAKADGIREINYRGDGTLKMKSLLNDFFQDVRYGLRSLRKSPGFTVVAVLTLALGIGANTTIFSLLQTFFFYPFAWEDPDRVAYVYSANPSRGVSRTSTSVPNFADWRAQSDAFEELAAIRSASFNLTGAGEPLRVEGLRATHNFFSMLKVEPGHGRFFLPEEDRPGGDRVVVLTHKGWQQIFERDPDVLGKKISLNREPYTVIGITPPDFKFTPSGKQLWVPFQLDPAQSDRARPQISVVGRFRKDVTKEQAQAEMSTIAQRLEQQYPDTNKGWGALVMPLPEILISQGDEVSIILYGTVLFVLLIACANVANLLLSRAAVREKEIGIRTALGAGRLRLIRQLLTESLLLALLGAALGLLLAVWSMNYLKTIVASTPGISFLAQGLHPNPRVLIFTLLIALLVTVVIGIVPALRGSKADPNETIKEGGRRAGGGRHPQRLRNLFVVAEVTLAVVLMIATGLILRTANEIYSTDPGFDTSNLLTLQVSLPAYSYPEKDKITAYYDEALQKVKALPGVESATVANMVPFVLNRPRRSVITLEGKEDPADGTPRTGEVVTVSPEYFQVIEIPLLRGRLLAGQDSAMAPPVAVLSQRLAQLHWPGEEALGKRFKMGSADSKGPWITVVGIVGDIISDSRAEPPDPLIYRPHSQNPDQTMAFLARTTVNPVTLIDPVRKAVWAVDENLPLFNVKTMTQALEAYDGSNKVVFSLLALFALTALLLSGVGIYGVISYAVNHQTHEIGVRMALGAQPGSILRLIVGQGMFLVSIGLLLGLAGGYGIGRLLNSQISSVFTYNEPLIFGGITLLFASVALLACYFPARRATKIDPMVALRYE